MYALDFVNRACGAQSHEPLELAMVAPPNALAALARELRESRLVVRTPHASAHQSSAS